MMAGIRGKNTRPELVLRRALHGLGLRYRLHSSAVVGKPDLIFPRYQAAIFVHGCFWHRHVGCRFTTTPATRPEFWQTKFDANLVRDADVRRQLLSAGWRVAVVWECALRRSEQIESVAALIQTWLRGAALALEVGGTEPMLEL